MLEWLLVWLLFYYQVEQKEKRYALPNSEIMIHQPMGGAHGQATEIQIAAKHILRVKERMNKIFAENTNKTIEQINQDTERDFYMFAEEALEYGIIDEIMVKKDIKPNK